MNKYKIDNNYTIDLQVIDVEHGKHADKIGALKCKTIADGKTIITDIGAGLTDAQRKQWHEHPETIKNKIIEVKYFELTQNENTQGSSIYSLRFPRFLRVREDKAEPGETIEAVKNELQKPNQAIPSRPRESAKETTNEYAPPKFLFLKTWGIIFLIVSILYLIAR